MAETVKMMQEPIVRPAPASVEPAKQARANRLQLEAASERVIHVHIGEIEVQAGPPVPAAPSPAAATPPAAETISGGFEDFTGLRSYSPWSW